MKKMIISSLVVTTLLNAGTPVMQAAAAEKNESIQVSQTATEINESINKTEIIKNDKYIQFEEEYSSLQEAKANKFSTFSTGNRATLSEEEFYSLVQKYDGAEKTVVVNSTTLYQEKFVQGGINFFATTYSGMQQLRSDLATTATGLQVSGFLTGALAGGFLGAFVGLLGSDILADRVRDGSNHIQSWLNALL
ncbi:hypothetical protein [uncultured Trichococcus sp.]|uniref:hypothetical protein n=1 Tax=uncultured Trichococcus sp. TaxID=189665 RepID=UPI0029C99D94|nr:hypothetical protein [uncultured Trichococcus sp.]